MNCMTWDEILILIERARIGDAFAFSELVQRFQPAVFAVAVARLRNEHEALELTQEVFVHAWKKLAQLRDARCFVSWLKQITVRMAINRMTRRAPIHGAEPETLQAHADGTVGPLDQIIRGEVRAEVQAGLARLKPLDRATLIAFYLQGQTLKQMSRAFETPIGTIKRRLHVARNRLRAVLAGEESGEPCERASA
jgi:RNA polymerase sigma-70 factor (ECF subfamily)